MAWFIQSSQSCTILNAIGLVRWFASTRLYAHDKRVKKMKIDISWDRMLSTLLTDIHRSFISLFLITRELMMLMTACSCCGVHGPFVSSLCSMMESTAT